MKRLPNLTPLRFILAFIVFIYHLANLCNNQGLPYFNKWPIFQRGHEAVYMFFVLSGFLIIGIIYRSKVAGNFSIKNFYMRRILRILPLYYLIIIFGFFFYQVVLPFANIPYENNYDLSTGILLTVFFLPNIFASYSPGGILEILWSIGIEEQFYLMIAPLLYFLNKKKILITLTIICVSYFFIFYNKNFTFFYEYRFVYFFLFSGGIIAIMEEKNMLSFLKSSKIVSIAIITLTVLFFTTDLLLLKNTILYNILICVLFSLFVYTISYANFNIEIKNKTLNYLGKISYGFYMYHFIASTAVVFLFQVLLSKTHLPDWVSILSINVLTLILSIIISHLSYKYFETYFLNLKKNYRNY